MESDQAMLERLARTREVSDSDAERLMSEHRLICGNCLDPVSGLASLPDKSVDHVITDPPYSRDLYARMRTNKAQIREGGVVTRSDSGARAAAMANLRIGAIDDILPEVVSHIVRVARRWTIIFSDFEIAGRWREGLGKTYIRTGVWVKPDAMPQISGDRPAQGFETVTLGHATGRKRWNGGGRPAVWTFTRGSGAAGFWDDHPCPKPLPLMEVLVADFTDPGELICDPFAGSGTTGVAAKRLGRRFIGWERDEKYWRIAEKRIAAAREQLNIFRERPAEPKQAALLSLGAGEREP